MNNVVCINCGEKAERYNIIERYITKPNRLLQACTKIKCYCNYCESIW